MLVSVERAKRLQERKKLRVERGGLFDTERQRDGSERGTGKEVGDGGSSIKVSGVRVERREM